MIDGNDKIPKRESQMMHFRGPWIAEKAKNKKGKSRYTIRSHLLDTSSLSRFVDNYSQVIKTNHIIYLIISVIQKVLIVKIDQPAHVHANR